MDCPYCGLGWFCIRHAGIQLRHFRGAKKRDRLGVSGVEPQGCCVCELRKRMGARAVQQLRETAIEIQMAPIRSSVHIPVATLWAHFQGGDVEKGLAELEKQANVMIDDLLWWTAALKTARES